MLRILAVTVEANEYRGRVGATSWSYKITPSDLRANCLDLQFLSHEMYSSLLCHELTLHNFRRIRGFGFFLRTVFSQMISKRNC